MPPGIGYPRTPQEEELARILAAIPPMAEGDRFIPPGAPAPQMDRIGMASSVNPMQPANTALASAPPIGAVPVRATAPATTGPVNRDGEAAIDSIMARLGGGAMKAGNPITTTTETAEPAAMQLANMLNAVPQRGRWVNQQQAAAERFARMTGGRGVGGPLWNIMVANSSSPNVMEWQDDPASTAAMGNVVGQFQQGQQQASLQRQQYDGLGRTANIKLKADMARSLMQDPKTYKEGLALLQEAIADHKNQGQPGPSAKGPKQPEPPLTAAEILSMGMQPSAMAPALGARGFNPATGNEQDFANALIAGLENPVSRLDEAGFQQFRQHLIPRMNPQSANETGLPPLLYRYGPFRSNVDQNTAALLGAVASEGMTLQGILDWRKNQAEANAIRLRNEEAARRAQEGNFAGAGVF